MKFSSLLILLFSFSSFGLSKFSLELALENRLFLDDENPITNGNNHSFQATPEFKFKEGVFRFIARGQAQYDMIDDSKNFIYPEDLWLGLNFDNHHFKIGYQVLNWSTNEAFHPIDTINSRNFDTNIRNAGKIGELMASYKFLFGDNSLFAYFSPQVQRPFFTEASNQFGFGATLEDPFFVDRDGNISSDSFIPQFGFRFNTQLADLDISLSYLNHVSRETPLIAATLNPQSQSLEITPFLIPASQVGLSLQSPIGGFVLKTQIAHKMFDETMIEQVYSQYRQPGTTNAFIKDYTQAALGLERSLAFDQGDEATVFFEVQNYFGLENTVVDSNIIFESDALLGVRYSFNDEQSRELFASLIFDYNNFDDFIFQLNYSQRVYQSWKISLGYQGVTAPSSGGFNLGASALDNSDHGYLTLIKYF